MRRAARLLPVLVLFAAAACGPSGHPEDVEYADSLGVDLAAMTKTESGLYLQDRVVGTGLEAAAGHIATVDYKLWFPDGRLVESSYERNAPFSFQIGAGSVIQGWDEGIAGMKVGGIRLLVLPSDLAYGPDGSRSIPGNQVLVFEVELHELSEN